MFSLLRALAFIVLVGGISANSLAWAGTAETPRNVVIIIADDMGYGDVGTHGNEAISTPVLDHYSANAVRFDRFYVSPVCAPTRAALLTGRWPLRTGVNSVGGSAQTLPANEITIAEILGEAGYRTALFGKWHNGLHFPNTPVGQGFEEFVGFRGGYTRNYFDTLLERNGASIATEGYLPDVLTDATIDFIKNSDDRPFLAVLAFNTPHAPYQASDEWYLPYKDKGLSDRMAASYAMIENLDWNVGRLTAALEELGHDDDTYVVFVSDNGPDFQRYNADLRGKKGDLDEGGTRVPALLWGAGLEPVEISTPAQHIDLVPTLLDLLDLGHLKHSVNFDGQSLRGLVLGGSAPDLENRLIFSQYSGKGDVAALPGAVRQAQWLSINHGEGWALYDLTKDPGQTTDLATSFAALSRYHAAAYSSWFGLMLNQPAKDIHIAIGDPAESSVTLQAIEAQIIGDGIALSGASPHSFSWLTDWADTTSTAQWPIRVAQSGTYVVAINYAADLAALPAKARVTVGGDYAEANITEAQDLYAEAIASRWPVPPPKALSWRELRLGPIYLHEGENMLVLQAQALSGDRFVDVSSVTVSGPVPPIAIGELQKRISGDSQ